jgi:hypothetical protein
MEVRVESIADRSQAYSVSAKSWFASYKLVLKHNQGLLTEVSLTSDSSAVAAESVKAVGEVKKSKIEAETEATKKAVEKQETAAKERRDEMKKLQDSLADAQIEAAQAAAALETLKDSADVTKKEEAKIAKAKADAKVDELKKRVELGQVGSGGFSIVKEDVKKLQDSLAKAQLEAAKAAAALEALKETKDEKAKAEAAKAKEKADDKVKELEKELKNAESKFNRISRPGPVILLVKEDATSGVLQLVPVNFDAEPQKMFASYERPAKAADEKVRKPNKIEFDKPEIDFRSSTTSVKIDITTKNEFASLRVGSMTGSQGNIDPNLWPKVSNKNSKTFELEFKGNTPPNSYTIKFLGNVDLASPTVEGEIKVKVTP